MRLIDADALLKALDADGWKHPSLIIHNAPTVEQATIVTQIDAVKFQEALDAMCADKDKQIAELQAEIEKIYLLAKQQAYDYLKAQTDLQAQINDLREALELVDGHCKVHSIRLSGNVQTAIDQTLAKTAPQCLQEHDNEVIEKCAKVCDEIGKRDQFTRMTASAFAHEIRALKGKQNV